MNGTEPIGGGTSRKGLNSTPPLYTKGIKVRPMSEVGTMICQVVRKGFLRRIS